MTRRRFTEREVVSIVARQLEARQDDWNSFEWHPAIICPICREQILGCQLAEIERDHDDAVGFGEGRDTPKNCRFVHGHCHKQKTAKDKARIAKAKRQAGETGQRARRDRNGPTLPSRPMQKAADVGRRHNWKTGRMEDV